MPNGIISIDDTNDAKSLGNAIFHFEKAMEYLMGMHNPLGYTLFHLTNSIVFYIEEYLSKEKEDLPYPSYSDLHME